MYVHFVVFLVSSVFLIVLNKIFNLDVEIFINWYIWVITLWFFFLVLHFINVFFTNRFMGKEWERKQTDKLILKQELKIAKIEKGIVHEAKLKAESEQYADELKKKETPQDNSIKE